MLPYINKLEEKKERFLENLSLILLAILLVVTPIVYFIVPEKILILTQSDAGAIDTYNSKSALWLFPLIGFVIYMALSIIKFYLIKYRDEPVPGEELQHATTVWMMRLVKVIAMGGLIVSVFEILVGASPEGSSQATVAFICEAVIVAGIFFIAIKEIMARYSKPAK